MPEIIANEAHRKLVPGFGGRISAALVWDGTDEVRIPAAMGVPRADQMQGTARERLVELAGRCCYDSLGKGRSSADYAKHLIDVGHLSVLEHATFTILVNAPLSQFADQYLNKPCLWVRSANDGQGVGASGYRVTANLRHAREWESTIVGDDLRTAGNHLAPGIVTRRGVIHSSSVHIVEPETDNEKWISLYMTGSRGWSHELVRHGDWTAISQRSTRYVDESESEWVLHPLLAEFFSEIDTPSGEWFKAENMEAMDRSIRFSKATYQDIVRSLEPWLIARGVDKTTARKQARGAARGMLGNALETECIFSASVAQWRHMLSMRAADAADAEIRLGFAMAVLPCLRESRYADRFADIELRPAGDGIGMSLVGGGHR